MWERDLIRGYNPRQVTELATLHDTVIRPDEYQDRDGGLGGSLFRSGALKPTTYLVAGFLQAGVRVSYTLSD